MKNIDSFRIGDLVKITDGKLLWGSPDIEAKGISLDSRTLCRGELFLALRGNNFDGHNFLGVAIKKGSSALIVSSQQRVPARAPIPVILVKDTLRALGVLARFHRKRFKIPVIAVTGSNGKTTTKDMVAQLLKEKYRVLKNEGTKNNQVGVPMTLLRLNAKHQAAVLELGSNHFGEIDYLGKIVLPDIAVITNIGPSHLKFFKTLSGVAKEKLSLLNSLSKKGAAIINGDDPFLRQRRRRGLWMITFGIKNQGDFSAGAIVRKGDRTEFLLNRQYKISLNSPSISNVYNALAAVACARWLRISFWEISRALKRFHFPSGRLQIRRSNGIRVIDDTYNANPLSLHYAVEVLKGYDSARRRILVCADMCELGERALDLHQQVGRYIAASRIDLLITVGELGRYIAQGAKAAGFSLSRLRHFISTEDAGHHIAGLVRRGDTVLIKGSRAMGMEAVVSKLMKY
ncbi:MAG: UDP-N-acetylmuramoyl-tripeptide--D-alanyl-D-alanine ligase [Candidatus Omnitrophota bacterium]